jgi:transposase
MQHFGRFWGEADINRQTKPAGADAVLHQCIRPLVGATLTHRGLREDQTRWREGRDFAAWLGLVPRKISTGDRTILGKISKRGNRYLRVLFVHPRHAHQPPATAILARKSLDLDR